MNPPQNKDPLDAWLQENNPHVDDAGFTARVMSALPRRRASLSLRMVVLLGAVVIGSVLAAFCLPWSSLPPLSVAAIHDLNTHVLLPWLMVVLVIASISWAAFAAIQTKE